MPDMNNAKAARSPLSEDTCRQFAAMVLLDRIITDPKAYHAALLDGDDSLLEPIFDTMLRKDLITVGEDDYYHPTGTGEQAYRKLLHQQQSYLVNFDLFGAVDLAEGTFADAETDTLEALNWSDLRVAVAEFKSIDPYRLVFLSMLADGSFLDNPDWKFDIALGSSFFKEMEEIVRTQISVDELGYEDEDGSWIPGDAVLEDVILQGAKINKARIDRERQRQASFFDEEDAGRDEDEGSGEEMESDLVVMAPYNPWAPAAAYMGSALFVEALWLSAFW